MDPTQKTIKQLEAALFATRAELDAQQLAAKILQDNVPMGIVYLDQNLVFRSANPAYCEFMRLPHDQIVGRDLFDVVTGGEGQLAELFENVLATGEPFVARDFRFLYTTDDGLERETFWDFTNHAVGWKPARRADGVGVMIVAMSDKAQVLS